MKKQIISCVIGIVSASQDLVAGQQQLAGLPLQNSLTANVASQPIDKQHLIYKVRANGLQRFTALILSDGDKEQFLQKTVQADKVLQ